MLAVVGYCRGGTPLLLLERRREGEEKNEEEVEDGLEEEEEEEEEGSPKEGRDSQRGRETVSAMEASEMLMYNGGGMSLLRRQALAQRKCDSGSPCLLLRQRQLGCFLPCCASNRMHK